VWGMVRAVSAMMNAPVASVFAPPNGWNLQTSNVALPQWIKSEDNPSHLEEEVSAHLPGPSDRGHHSPATGSATHRPHERDPATLTLAIRIRRAKMDFRRTGLPTAAPFIPSYLPNR
jgi:hypothetical protein